MDAGQSLRMAYRSFPVPSIHWTDIKDYLNGTNETELQHAVFSLLPTIQASGDAMIFDSDTFLPPFGVVKGNEFWEAKYSAWAEPKMFRILAKTGMHGINSLHTNIDGTYSSDVDDSNGEAAEFFANSRDITEVTCIAGCES